MMRVKILFCTAILALQGCEMPAPSPGPVAPPADLSSCHAMGLDGLIGQPLSQLPQYGKWSTLRVIKPGMMITMDYSATRLNVRVNGANRILELSCG
ncbi:MAG: I78 family peptidase inhibitor [bacterium]